MKKTPPRITKAERKLAASIFGRIGGQSKSDAKTEACRANASKPRPAGRKPRRPRTDKKPNRTPAKRSAKN